MATRNQPGLHNSQTVPHIIPRTLFFDPSKPTRLCTNASWQGLGLVLQQKTGDTRVLVQAGSRFLSDAESCYAVIELELLAVSWTIIKCKIFLAGPPHFTVVTDHHPLVPILNSHRLDEIENPRLQRLKTKIMAYNFTTAPSKEPDLSSTGQGWTTTSTTLSSLASNAKNTCHLTLGNPSPYQTQTRTAISGTCSRFLLLCLTGFPHPGGLLLGLAWCHPHGPQYHHTPINHCPQERFLPLGGARYPLVRPKTTIHL